MQLQQLRYLIAAAEAGSIRAAAQRMYVSQSSLSVAVKDLEQETGVTAFDRTSHGITLTKEGADLVGYARRVVEQADLMEAHYQGGGVRKAPMRLSVSSQHYSMVVQAFGDFTHLCRDVPESEFALRETYANQVIRDVSEGRSDMGFMYMSNYNDRVVSRALDKAGLVFTSLFVSQPTVYVGEKNPLAGRSHVSADDLAPYYLVRHEQGIESSSYFSEEPMAQAAHDKTVVVSDNDTLASLLRRQDSYTLATGVYTGGEGVVGVPLDGDEAMNVGQVRQADRALPAPARDFMTLLGRRVVAGEGQAEPSPYAYECARRGLLLGKDE